VSLSRPLDVFSVGGLADYFARVGSFAKAVTEISDFLIGQGNSIDTATPPVLLIEGPGGTGRKTLGNFAAHLMKDHSLNPPSFRMLPVTTDHFGRLLFEIKDELQEHFGRSNLDPSILKRRDTFIKPEDPDETVLAGLFNSVAQQNLGLPMLILLIDVLEYRNFDWIGKLHGMLKNLNVALIFLTKDQLVTERFKSALARSDYIGCSVCLAPLTMQEGKELLEHRLTIFRHQAGSPGVTRLTPYEMAAIQWSFTGGNASRTVKWLLSLYRITMNFKLANLVSSGTALPGAPGTPGPSIGESDVREAFEKSLRQGSWGA
jgi:hypothetical protein